MNDTSLTRLPQDIGRLSGLKSLELRENHLRSLPPSFIKLRNLQRLDLGQNDFDEIVHFYSLDSFGCIFDIKN